MGAPGAADLSVGLCAETAKAMDPMSNAAAIRKCASPLFGTAVQPEKRLSSRIRVRFPELFQLRLFSVRVFGAAGSGIDPH